MSEPTTAIRALQNYYLGTDECGLLRFSIPESIRQRIAEPLLIYAGEGWGHIAGSYPLSLISNVSFEPNDIDVFQSSNVDNKDSLKFRARALAASLLRFGYGTYAVSQSNGFKIVGNGNISGKAAEHSGVLPIQLFGEFQCRSGKAFGAVNEVLRTFDFTVCQVAITKGVFGNCAEFALSRETATDIQNAHLRYSGTYSTYSPYRLFNRILKYVQRGFLRQYEDNSLALMLFHTYDNWNAERIIGSVAGEHTDLWRHYEPGFQQDTIDGIRGQL